MAGIYEIKYHSVNEYEEAVAEANFEFLVFPCNDLSQSLIEYSIKQSTEDDRFYSTNSFGFRTIRIRSKKMFKKFSFTFTAKVQKHDLGVDFINNMPPKEQISIIESRDFYIDNHLLLSKTPFTKISADNNKFIFLYKKDIGILEYLSELNAYIYNLLSYRPNTTTVHTTADEVIRLKQGVCQDYTHLFLAIAREIGIPCRYVSGYLDQGSKYIGSAMMHAWAEAFVPGMGWIGFDPTNNIRVNSFYVKIAHGVDYNDCSPIKGILITKGENKTSYQVEVSQQ